jgi:hypothetical protein
LAGNRWRVVQTGSRDAQRFKKSRKWMRESWLCLLLLPVPSALLLAREPCNASHVGFQTCTHVKCWCGHIGATPESCAGKLTFTRGSAAGYSVFCYTSSWENLPKIYLEGPILPEGCGREWVIEGACVWKGESLTCECPKPPAVNDPRWQEGIDFVFRSTCSADCESPNGSGGSLTW